MFGEKEYIILVNNIKFYRSIRDLTQEQLAELADLSVSYIKQLESGKVFKNVSLITLSKLAFAFQISVDELLKNENEQIPV